MQKTDYSKLAEEKGEIGQYKISVIVSVYNIENYIERAVESICAQKHSNLEILLVDDGSTDNSGKMCDAFADRDPRIRVWHKSNGGLSSARNAGIEQATGEYIAFVDGDDWIDPEMYQDMLRAMLLFDADLAVCNFKYVGRHRITDTSTKEITILEGREALQLFVEEEEEYQIQNAAWNKLYKKSLMGDLRFPEGKLFEDIVYTTKLLAKSRRTVYLDQAYYNYLCERSDSIMNSRKVARLLTDQVPAYQEKGEFLLSIGEKELFLTHQYFFYKRMLNHYREVRQQKPEAYRDFLHSIQKVIKTSPVWEAFQGKPKGVWFRFCLFLLSPSLYYAFVLFYETYVVPYKQLKHGQKEPLVVVQLSGGMGNQMFQYALYLQLKALGRNVKIDDRTAYQNRNARPLRLEIFGVRYDTSTEEEMKCLTDSYGDLFSRIRRKLTGRKTAEYEEKSLRFDPEVLKKERAYLTGCWQSETYFADVREEVREAFTFRGLTLSPAMQQYEAQMQRTPSVSVHIRRGDYLKADEIYGGICTESYYARAMEQMRKEIPNCHFFFFTNDIQWVKEHYIGEDVTVVEGNDEDSGYVDLYLMTRCRHYILANSSFSWWGCYLNPSADKKVIAPARWVNGRECEDIYTGEMQRLG